MARGLNASSLDLIRVAFFESYSIGIKHVALAGLVLSQILIFSWVVVELELLLLELP